MTIKDASYLALEAAFNRYLSFDPEISHQFVRFHGKRIGFELRGLNITLFFIPDQTGKVQILSQIDGTPDCLISGSPLNLLRSSGQKSTDQIFSGEVTIQGNTRIAQEFTKILLQIDIDWEEQLSHLTGDLLAHQIGQQFNQSRSWLLRNLKVSGFNLQEYLQEEIRLLPGFYELENFYTDIDIIRDHSERLQARILRLKNKNHQTLSENSHS